MSGPISVSPFGRMPSFGLTAAFGAGVCAFADGDEQPAAAASDTAAAMRNSGFIMMGTFYHFGEARHRKDLSSFFSVSPCLPVELRPKAREARRNDRGRRQVRRARAPVDVRGGVRVGEVVAVHEHRDVLARRDLERLLDAHV